MKPTKVATFCLCGQPSARAGQVVTTTLQDGCARCLALESRPTPGTREARPPAARKASRRAPLVAIRRACDAALRRRGLNYNDGAALWIAPDECDA